MPVSLIVGFGLEHSLSLALKGSVLGRAVLVLGFFVFLVLTSSLVSSTQPLVIRKNMQPLFN